MQDLDIDRIIEMAWEDRTSFDAIKRQFGIGEQEVIEIMRREMKPSSFKRSEEHTSELQSRQSISYAVFCLKKRFF